MNLNDHLFEVEFQLEKRAGNTEADFLARRAELRKALAKWGDSRYLDGYGDGQRDLIDARIKAREHEKAEGEENGDG